MPRRSIFDMKVSKIYPLLLRKVQRRGRAKEELDEVIRRLDKLADEPAKGKPMAKILR